MSGRRILLVEEDEALANGYRLALSTAGFEVNVAGDGLSALEDIDEARPDLVVLNMQLPQLAGAAVLHEVASSPETRDIPVIVMTAFDAPDCVAPVSAVLRAPCDASTLVAAVTHHLH